jgi:hypothetical protein
MTILRKQSDIHDADMADLLETYNALTGNAVERFESRAIAERRTEMAMLAARDAAGHAGVPKGVEPEVKTMDELALPFGPMVQQLHIAAENARAEAAPKRIKAMKARELTARPLRTPADKIRATFAGTSKPQAASIRGQVLRAIQESEGHTVAQADLDAHMGMPTRSFVQKLIEAGHLELVA